MKKTFFAENSEDLEFWHRNTKAFNVIIVYFYKDSVQSEANKRFRIFIHQFKYIVR